MCRYNEIRNLFIERPASSWMEDSTGQKIRADVETKIKSFANGDLEHATEVLSALWEIANNDRIIKNPSDAGRIVNPYRLCFLCERATARGVEGRRSNLFGCQDRDALEVRSRRKLLRQEILGKKLQEWGRFARWYGQGTEFPSVVKYVKGGNPPISDLEGDANVESDCDGHISGVNGELPDAKEKKETRAVLITGSFSAYVRFNFTHIFVSKE